MPGEPGARPVGAMLTITTSNPKWDNTERLVLHAKLARHQDRVEGRPAELGNAELGNAELGN